MTQTCNPLKTKSQPRHQRLRQRANQNVKGSGMDAMPDTFWSWAMTVATAALGWLIKTVWGKIDKQEDAHQALVTELARNYVTKADFREEVRDVSSKLDRLNDKMDTVIQLKADKHDTKSPRNS